jgi:Tol biopolymer transport system component
VGKRFSYLTGNGSAFKQRIEAAVCAGEFIAAVGSPPDDTTGNQRLFLLDKNGGFVQDLTDGVGYDDFSPLWGPLGTGVAFVRVGTDSGASQVWFIAEGGRAVYAGYDVTPPDTKGNSFGWRSVLDWSADRATGTPTDL